MPSLATNIALICMTAGVAGIWSRNAERTSREGPQLPVAAMAWAQSHCDAAMTPGPAATRVQAEDLYRVAAMLDSERSRDGLERACRHAASLAGRVAHNGSLHRDFSLSDLIELASQR